MSQSGLDCVLEGTLTVGVVLMSQSGLDCVLEGTLTVGVVLMSQSGLDCVLEGTLAVGVCGTDVSVRVGHCPGGYINSWCTWH